MHSQERSRKGGCRFILSQITKLQNFRNVGISSNKLELFAYLFKYLGLIFKMFV